MLVKNRVRPYYLYQCDLSRGIEHFRTPISKGIEILEMLIGHTSGLAVPTFVVDAPGGGGKIPLCPITFYLIPIAKLYCAITKALSVFIPNRKTSPPAVRPIAAYVIMTAPAIRLVWKKLYSDDNDIISLIPEGNSRHSRRE